MPYEVRPGQRRWLIPFHNQRKGRRSPLRDRDAEHKKASLLGPYFPVLDRKSLDGEMPGVARGERRTNFTSCRRYEAICLGQGSAGPRMLASPCSGLPGDATIDLRDPQSIE
jgi:hypothetical protein